jgi:hypothetical protein
MIMTLRAVLVGLVGALFIAGVSYISEQTLGLIGLSPLSGHQIPVGVIGALIVFLAAVNPVLFLLRRSWGFKPAEVATATLMMLVACSVPLRGLMENLPTTLGLPAYWNSVNPGWRKNNLMSYVPPVLLPAGGELDPAVADDMLSGLGKRGAPIGVQDVPWGKWRDCLSVWLLLVALLAISVICLALVVHRQWATHERLRYPIAEFASTLMEPPQQGFLGPIFRSKLFWLGLAAVAAIHLVNGINQWHKGTLIQIPLTFDFVPIRRKWPDIQQLPWGSRMTIPSIYPIVVGFSFFLASEVSLSLGLAQVAFLSVAWILLLRGQDVSTDLLTGGVGGWMRVGGYAAFAAMLLYTGRRYYLAVLRASVTFRPQTGVESYAAWAGRILIVALGCMLGIIIAFGLDWPFAILTVGLMMLIFFCAARIVAETGLIFLQARWQPLGALLGFFGAYALGPKAVVLVGFLSIVLTLEISQCLIMYFVNGLRICQNMGIRPARAGWTAAGTYLASLALAIMVVFWAVYNYGVNKSYYWAFERVPSMVFVAANREVTQLKLAGELASSEGLSPLRRLAESRPSQRFLWSAGIGVALVLAVGALRLRLSWWPLHPVMFLVWDTYPMAALGHSFLLGWLVKTAVTRIGGHKTYQKAKPLMIGIIAGDLLGPTVFIVYGALYYGATGLLPVVYDYFPK